MVTATFSIIPGWKRDVVHHEIFHEHCFVEIDVISGCEVRIHQHTLEGWFTSYINLDRRVSNVRDRRRG